jgi:hypothetical protein
MGAAQSAENRAIEPTKSAIPRMPIPQIGEACGARTGR